MTFLSSPMNNELCVVRSNIQVMEKDFLTRVPALSLKDGAEELCHSGRTQSRAPKTEHLTRTPPGHLVAEVFQAFPMLGISGKTAAHMTWTRIASENGCNPSLNLKLRN